jgi:hypothetical protein
MERVSSGESVGISKDDVEKIQVLLKALEVMQNLFFSWKLNNILS